MEVALGALLALCIICLAYVTAHSRLDPGPPLTTHTLLVATKNGEQFRGILHAQHADRWVLAEAVVVRAVGIEDQAVGGVVHVPIDNIAWAQEPRPDERG